jgi:isoquinoline 1-oxidoreductase beta subunit
MEAKESISRRHFIKLGGMSGATFMLGLHWSAQAKEMQVLTSGEATALGVELNNFILIDSSGKVTIMNHRAEMGQGAFQAVPSIIAEELEVDMNDINIVFAPGNEKRYGSQITGGSSTVRGAYKRLSKLGASAREMLIEAAARKWNVSASECYAEKGKVFHRPTARSFHYGQLVEEASKLSPPQDVALKLPKDYKIIRKPMPRPDVPLKTNGAAGFGLDFKMPGMLYAVVERSPRFNGVVKSFDDTATRKVPGVKRVFKVQREVFDHMREGVAVVADSTWAAMQGRKVLKVEWDDSGFEHVSTELLYSRMKEALEKGQGVLSFKTRGNADDAFSKSSKKVTAVYETPYESHSNMEPLNCVAHVQEGKCEIWGPIQTPGWAQEAVSKQLGLTMEQVTVNMTFLGGGLGRKAFNDFPIEAALISKEIKAPVKVVWTREDDMTAGPFRPGMVYKCEGGLSENGSLRSYKVIGAGQNMGLQGPNADFSSYNDSITEGFLETYFDGISNWSFGDIPLKSAVPVMWWRSVYSSTNGFAFESFMDELAAEAGVDPLEFRKRHFRSGRHHNLARILEEKSGWKDRKKGEGWGVAITECFASIVGEVVKVSRDPKGGVKIDKVIAVMDCGWYVNPDNVRAQVEGSIVMAIGAAAIHESTFKEGKAVENNFLAYKMPRITDTPVIEVHIVDNDEPAGGVGEPGLPPLAPALCNAIFDLTGKRIRRLPFDLKTI